MYSKSDRLDGFKLFPVSWTDEIDLGWECVYEYRFDIDEKN